MAGIFQKLNLKDQREIVVLNAPESFLPALDALVGVTVRREIEAAATLAFVLAFVTRLAEVEALAAVLASRAVGDAVVWFAYPKGTSKKYRCEFNRDTGWAALGQVGFEPVRQVAIDEDWSALRFRRVEYIQSLTRTTLRPLSEQGKSRLQKDADR